MVLNGCSLIGLDDSLCLLSGILLGTVSIYLSIALIKQKGRWVVGKWDIIVLFDDFLHCFHKNTCVISNDS